MKSNLLTIAHTPRLRAAFNHGKWKAGYMHVSTRPREIIRAGIQSIKKPDALRPEFRADRRALYAGMFSALRNERRMMAAFNL